MIIICLLWLQWSMTVICLLQLLLNFQLHWSMVIICLLELLLCLLQLPLFNALASSAHDHHLPASAILASLVHMTIICPLQLLLAPLAHDCHLSASAALELVMKSLLHYSRLSKL